MLQRIDVELLPTEATVIVHHHTVGKSRRPTGFLIRIWKKLKLLKFSFSSSASASASKSCAHRWAWEPAWHLWAQRSSHSGDEISLNTSKHLKGRLRLSVRPVSLVFESPWHYSGQRPPTFRGPYRPQYFKEVEKRDHIHVHGKLNCLIVIVSPQSNLNLHHSLLENLIFEIVI